MLSIRKKRWAPSMQNWWIPAVPFFSLPTSRPSMHSVRLAVFLCPNSYRFSHSIWQWWRKRIRSRPLSTPNIWHPENLGFPLANRCYMKYTDLCRNKHEQTKKKWISGPNSITPAMICSYLMHLLDYNSLFNLPGWWIIANAEQR